MTDLESRLIAAIKIFQEERGRHEEPHEFPACAEMDIPGSWHSCRFCEESYVRAEAKLDAVLKGVTP